MWVGQGALGSNARRVSSTEGHIPRTPTPELSSTSPLLWALVGGCMVSHPHANVSTLSLSLGRRSLWLNIRGKEAAALSMFHVSVPLSEVSDGVTGPGPWPSLPFLAS